MATARKKTQPTPPRPRKAAPARPAPPEPKLQPLEAADGSLVAFSFDRWLADHGLGGTKPVEAGGRVWQFRVTGTTEENTKLYAAMATGQYRAALEIMLADPEQVDELLAVISVPFATESEQAMWRAFIEAVSGVTLPESSAS